MKGTRPVESSTLGQVRRTGKSRAEGDGPQYAALLKEVRGKGLLERSRTFYLTLTGLLAAVLTGLIIGMVFAGNSWLQIPLAIGLGIVLTQFAFIGHEASHRQVFESQKANNTFGRILASLIVGISYSWWMNKHTRHHSNPNRAAHDPDIEAGALVFRTEDVSGGTSLRRWFLRHQGTFFFPLLLLEGINLHQQGVRYLLDRRSNVHGRRVELLLLLARLIAMPAFLFSVLSPGWAVTAWLVQLGTFGVYMGASFAPNHKGMPQVPAELKLSFFHKQVLTSRNIKGFGMTGIFGGLNYQVEHHLFPNMPRPHLKQAAAIVQDYCRRFDVPYTAVRLTESYRAVVQYLNNVGRSDRDLFECPLVTSYGRL